jgi:hypothetical protein
VHDGLGAAQRLERLAVVGQVGLEHAFEAISLGDRDVGGRHLVTVLGQVPRHRPARLAGRSRHADPLCHGRPFAPVMTCSQARTRRNVPEAGNHAHFPAH